MYRNCQNAVIVFILAMEAVSGAFFHNIAFSSDELSAAEYHRRTDLPCVIAKYGPFSGVFVVDTGATLSAAYGTARFRESPDPEWQFREIDVVFSIGSGQVSVIENIAIAAFGADAEPTRLVLLEKSEISSASNGIDGVLGLREMRELTLHLDHRRWTTRKLESTWSPNPSAVKTTLLRRGQKDVQIPVKFAAENTRVSVDTGCRIFLLLRNSTLKFQESLGNAVPANRVTAATAVAIREAQTYILKSVTICGFEFRDVQAQESSVNAIGMGCFSHFDMVLDFPQNEMWLTPHSDDWPKRVPPDASGLVLGYLDTNVLSLLRIQPDSAASKSELMLDDQILLFDGKEPKDLSMFEIHQRQTQAGTVLPLRIRRGDQETDIALPLGYSFEYPPKWSNEKNVLDQFNEFLEKDNKPSESESAGK